MPPKEVSEEDKPKEEKTEAEKELDLIGGKDLVLARMELDTTQNHLKEKIKEIRPL